MLTLRHIDGRHFRQVLNTLKFDRSEETESYSNPKQPVSSYPR